MGHSVLSVLDKAHGRGYEWGLKVDYAATGYGGGGYCAEVYYFEYKGHLITNPNRLS